MEIYFFFLVWFDFIRVRVWAGMVLLLEEKVWAWRDVSGGGQHGGGGGVAPHHLGGGGGGWCRSAGGWGRQRGASN